MGRDSEAQIRTCFGIILLRTVRVDARILRKRMCVLV